MAQFEVTEAPNVAIDNFLARRLSKGRVKQLFDQQGVRVRRRRHGDPSAVHRRPPRFICGPSAEGWYPRHCMVGTVARADQSVKVRDGHSWGAIWPSRPAPLASSIFGDRPFQRPAPGPVESLAAL